MPMVLLSGRPEFVFCVAPVSVLTDGELRLAVLPSASSSCTAGRQPVLTQLCV